jgi:selenide,water dikinase
LKSGWLQLHSAEITHDLVLLGGGHSHAIALKQFGMKPIPGVRLTLITDLSHTPYSGMLPAYVAGLYDFDACHIDLRRLSRYAGAVMVLDRAIGLDLSQSCVKLAAHPPIRFDLLSIDIGSTPATLPGSAEQIIPVKPISQFLRRWDQLIAQVTQQPGRLRIAVVGGGAGGVELMLAIQSRLSRLYASLGQPVHLLELHLLHRDHRLIPERSVGLGRQVQQILTQRGVQVHLGEPVTQISTSNEGKKICCQSGLTLECDQIFWVTQAAAADWLTTSGLHTDERGFILVNDYLQSVSHPQVFAAGDVATMVQHPHPKAGVFAVRQGKPLAQNLRRALAGEPFRSFVPQQEFLALIGMGDRTAIASRGQLALGPHPLLWRWKDWIDQRFMQKFRDLHMGMQMAEVKTSPKSGLEIPRPMPCAGCGSKVGGSVLRQALERVQPDRLRRSDILLGLDAADDAAVLQVAAGQVMVQTVDHFRALVNDPYVFGQICANHCLSDLFAMNAEPQSALAIVTLPYATAVKLEETLYQLLSGAIQVLSEAGAVLVGGHTTEGAELAFGLTCNGLAAPAQLWQKSAMQPGQALILTKPLGTGTLFAAEMQLAAKGRWIEAAIETMRQSNQAAVACLQQCGATACTDVTGFGLAGHLLELVQASRVAVELDLDALPILLGAKETVQQGIFSSLYAQNLQAAKQIENLAEVQAHPLFPILFDPQTAGGLLASVPQEQAADCVTALKKAGYIEAHIVGYALLSKSRFSVRVKIPRDKNFQTLPENE